MLGSVVHVDGGPADGAVAIHVDPDQVVAGIGVVAFAHGVQGEVVDAVVVAFVPGVDMAAEYAGDIPFFEFVEQVEGFFACEGRSEFVELRTEDVGVGEDEGIAVAAFQVFAVEDTFFDEFDLRLAERAAGRVQEDEMVEGDVPILEKDDYVDFVER